MSSLRYAILLCSLWSCALLAQPLDDFWRCVEEVQSQSGIPSQIIVAIKIVESGNSLNPPLRHNRNGTVDIGIMQTNSIWLSELATYGIDEEKLKDNCTSIKVAAWTLSKHWQKTGDLWEAVGRYHSKTPSLKKRYQKKVRSLLSTLPEQPQR